MFPSGIDASKARLLTLYVARANRKRLFKVHALKKLHHEIVKLKKASAKNTHPHIERFEKHVVEALEEGGFIEKCKEPATRVVEEISAPPERLPETSVEVAVAELSREQKLENIISVSQVRAEKPVPQLDELEKMLHNLEQLRNGIKATDPSEKEQLKNIVERINFVKQKIASLSQKKIVKHKKKAKRKK